MPKKAYAITFCVLITTINIYCTFLHFSDHSISKPDFSDEGSTIDIVYDDFSILLSYDDICMLESRALTGFIYFGRDTCPLCLKLNSALKDIISVHDISLYKFDTDIWRDDPKFDNILSLYGITNIPMIIHIDSNYNIVGVFTVESADISILQDDLLRFLLNQ